MGEKKSRLNAEQQLAVAHNEGPSLVVAGAGTGKTTVITERIARLVREGKATPTEVLALTFTEKAATEMQERVTELLQIGEVDSTIATFHSFGEQILRNYGLELGLSSDYQVLSSFQQQVVMNKVLDGLDLQYHRPLGRPTSLLNGISQFLSRLKDDNISPAAFAEFVSKQAKTGDVDEQSRIEELAAIYTAYERHCQSNSLLDYGDLLMQTYQLLVRRPRICLLIQNRYKFVLVDEYQDTNYIQAQLLDLLVAKHQNLMVVGDDDQSIYQFRGANLTNILKFRQTYPKATLVSLRRNYRSSQAILDASYRLISQNNPYRLEVEENISKQLLAAHKGTAPSIKVFESVADEHQWLVEAIQMLFKKGTPYREIAILVRKNSQSEELAYSLEKHHIPYQLSESKRLLDQPEIKNLLYFVRFIADQSDSQALFGLLVVDVYELELQLVIDAAVTAQKRHLSLCEYVTTVSNNLSLQSVVQSLTSYRDKTTELQAGELLYHFFEQSGYLKKLYLLSETDNSAAVALQNIAKFFQFVRDFERVSEDHGMFALWSFLREAAQAEAVIEVDASPLDFDAVRILTVHRSKGLEFDHVFVPNMVRRAFPAQRQSETIRPPEGLFDGKLEGIDWHIQEERRLLYVAMTRARRGLYLSCGLHNGSKMRCKPSAFLGEITDEVTEIKQNSVSTTTSNMLSSFALLKKREYDPLSRLIDEQGWLHLSVNQLVDFERDPEDFWYFDVLGMPKGPFHSLVYGSAIHAVLEQYYLGVMNSQPVTLKAMLDCFESKWDSEGFVSLKHEQARFETGKKVLKSFYIEQKNSKEQPLYVEKPFELRVEALKLAVRGRYDAIFASGDGVEIRDFKTSDVKDPKAADRKVRDSLQLKIYTLAWQQLMPQPVKAVSLAFVEHNLVAKRKPINTAKIMDKLATMVEQIRSGKYRSNLGERL